jgi:hypothetical protein
MSKARQLADLGNAYDDAALSNRNLIINGNFTISQRGDYTSSTSVSDGNYYLDRWEYIEDGSPTSSLIHNTDGTVKITTGASVTGSSRLRQKFEYDLFPRQYDNKTFTVSAKVKSNSANARINVYAGGYLSLTGTTVHSGGGDYETLTATFTTPTTITTEFSLHIGIDGASSANVSITSGEYFEVKEVQMELGDTATPFEHRSCGDELARCQRYFEKQTFSGGYQFVCNTINTATTQVEGFIPFMVEKRSTPTVTSSAASTWRVNALANDVTASGVSWFTGTEYGVRGRWTRASGTHVLRDASYVNVENASPYEAYVNIDAEL